MSQSTQELKARIDFLSANVAHLAELTNSMLRVLRALKIGVEESASATEWYGFVQAACTTQLPADILPTPIFQG
jgi:hypothetical protein